MSKILLAGRLRLLPLLALLVLAGCAGPATLDVVEAPPAGEPVVTLTILQMNDVYEITPVSGGTEGGLARVATLRHRLMREDSNLVTLIAGDFFGPSALGTARVDGERLRGRQMVAVLNALGLDVATYGNHEFDLDEEDFLKRVAESNFPYVSANVTDDEGALFPNQQRHLLVPVTDESGATMTLGIVGNVLPSNPKDYVRYADPVQALADEVAAIEGRADVIVALTHLAFSDDVRVAAEVPAVDLVLGGHEHENVRAYRGADLTPILKADANARTVYVHRLRYDPTNGALSVRSELVPITDAIPDDPAVAAEVERWVSTAFAGFEESGFAPRDVVTSTARPSGLAPGTRGGDTGARAFATAEGLDGREATIRTQPTNLGVLIAESFLAEAGDAELALFNGGSVRIDDVLPAGPVTQYDVIRVLPFGGNVLTVGVRGDVLRRALDQGVANRGTGGYLQTAGVARQDDGAWLIGGAPLDEARVYRVATNDFLVTGLETGLDFFNLEENPNIELLATHRDVRMVLIDALQARYGRP